MWVVILILYLISVSSLYYSFVFGLELLFRQKGEVMGDLCQPRSLRAWTSLGLDLLLLVTQRNPPVHLWRFLSLSLALALALSLCFFSSHATQLKLGFSFLFCEFVPYKKENIFGIFRKYPGNFWHVSTPINKYVLLEWLQTSTLKVNFSVEVHKIYFWTCLLST